MNKADGCRESILTAARAIHNKGAPTFTPAEIYCALRDAGSPYTRSTVVTYVSAIMCGDEVQKIPLRYRDLERVGRGQYRLRTFDPT